LICIAYMQGELNIFAIYRFMLSVSLSLTALFYVLHVCRRSFISPFINCILCVMWLGSSHLFFMQCMYAGGVNFTSFLFMNIFRISIYIFIVCFIWKGGEHFFNAPLLIFVVWQKGGEFFFVYAPLLIFFEKNGGVDCFWLFAYLC